MATTDIVLIDEQIPDISAEMLDRLRGYRQQILEFEAGIKKSVIAIGQILTDINDLLPRQDMFEHWTENSLGWSLSTAYNYMSVFKTFGALELEGGVDALPIPQSGLVRLARKSISEGTRQAIILEAQQGKTFTMKSLEREIREREKAQQRTVRSDPQELPPTECLFCNKKNIMIFPLRGTRRGICGNCMSEGLQFIADMHRNGLAPDLEGNHATEND